MSKSPSRLDGSFWIVKPDSEGHGVEVAEEDNPKTPEEYASWWKRQYMRFTQGEGIEEVAHFVQVGKSRWYDMLWCSVPFNRLVSDRFLSILEDTGATGWSKYPVRLSDRSGVRIQGYHGLCVHGKAGPQEVDRAKRVKRGHRSDPERQYWALKGYYFALESWDGTDLFLSESIYAPFVTDRVYRAMRRSGVKGIRFCSQLEYEVDERLVLHRTSKKPE